VKNLWKLVQIGTKVGTGTKQRHRNCEEDFDCRFENKGIFSKAGATNCIQ